MNKTDLTSATQFLEKTKVLGVIGGKVIPEIFQKDRAEQLWKKGEADKDGYFTLQNSKLQKFLTAISSSGLEIKGKITLRWITGYLKPRPFKFCWFFRIYFTFK